jgi:hypothetical protein
MWKAFVYEALCNCTARICAFGSGWLAAKGLPKAPAPLLLPPRCPRAAEPQPEAGFLPPASPRPHDTDCVTQHERVPCVTPQLHAYDKQTPQHSQHLTTAIDIDHARPPPAATTRLRPEHVAAAARDVAHPPLRRVGAVALQDLEVLEVEARRAVHRQREAQVDGADLGGGVGVWGE